MPGGLAIPGDVMLNDAVLSKIFNELDASLAPELERSLIVCGGASMIALGISSRSTDDVDVITPTIDEELARAATAVAKRYGLEPNWLNNGPADVAKLLPRDWPSRLIPVFAGERLKVYSLGRAELIITKLFAEADRGEDERDILGLAPTEAELDSAERLVKTFDANPSWPEHVANVVMRIKRGLGLKK